LASEKKICDVINFVFLHQNKNKILKKLFKKEQLTDLEVFKKEHSKTGSKSLEKPQASQKSSKVKDKKFWY